MAEMPLSASLPRTTGPHCWPVSSPGPGLDEVARAGKAARRRRGDGIGDGKSLQETAAWGYAGGVAEVCAQSLNEWLHRAAACRPWQPDNKAVQPCQGAAASTPRPGT